MQSKVKEICDAECAFQVGLVVKNLPADAGDVRDKVRSLGRGDPLEEGMATTPVFLPGESHGQRSLAGCSPWSCMIETPEHACTHEKAGSFVLMFIEQCSS